MKTPDHRLCDSIAYLLATLPRGARFEFFWEDGQQRARLSQPEMPVQEIVLRRDSEGVGHFFPLNE